MKEGGVGGAPHSSYSTVRRWASVKRGSRLIRELRASRSSPCCIVMLHGRAAWSCSLSCVGRGGGGCPRVRVKVAWGACAWARYASMCGPASIDGTVLSSRAMRIKRPQPSTRSGSSSVVCASMTNERSTTNERAYLRTHACMCGGASECSVWRCRQAGAHVSM